MVADEAWQREVSVALGEEVRFVRTLSGGDINQAREVELVSGRRVFVKLNERAPPRFFRAEAEGLELLREGLRGVHGLIVPEVIHIGEGFLVLELLHPQSRGSAQVLGEGLAELHRADAGAWGGPHPNFIGSLGQWNDTRPSWTQFFVDQRLRLQLSLAGAKRLINPGVIRVFDRLFERLPELLETGEPSSRLHGDLWSGNYCYVRGGAALFDPAVYVGHREVDLAMMRLFGGFEEKVFEAYESSYPLVSGADQRMKIYQLYPLLVHVNLFGAKYVRAVEESLRSLSCV